VQSYLRLHAVERCAAFLTPHLVAGMSLLDVGCGPDTITVGLAAILLRARMGRGSRVQGRLTAAIHW
jgi:ubiquinone/menaquinone biosynthesis C-methylase UbiE